LRPWKQRDEPFSVYSGSLDAFNYWRKVFFLGQAYDLACVGKREGGECRYQLTLTPTQPAVGELKITGRHVERAVLAGGPYLVVLDRPEPVVKVPVGSYVHCQVALKQGGTQAYRDVSRGAAVKEVAVNESRPAALTVGGPLTNTVHIARRGGNLVFNYQLLGADGQKYQLASPDPGKPPCFKVLQGPRVIATGKFEFG
jgi:hypothetical protein